MERNTLVFHKDWFDILAGLQDEERLQVYDAVMRYAFYGEESELTPAAKMAFSFIVKLSETNWKKYFNPRFHHS